ncbi:MAG TPA: peptide chain release factor N(5)-glutamine methyltransferase [Patescibacteria group bacterium]|nr:peptide chain release factor N(5)-glutamine methyltransferase [Patescibacteria group bacterium]
MYKEFIRCYELFRDRGVSDPLIETLRLFDVLSSGALRGTDLSFLDKQGIPLDEIVRRRKEGVPFEYVLGIAPFMGFTLYCTPETLIPRHDTELLAQTALNLIERMERPVTVIDMGTGSGNIAVALAMNAAGVKVLASDVSAAAIEVARRNIEKYSLQERVLLFSGDLFAPLRGMEHEGNIDLVVCNPPYIPTKSLAKLDAGITDHEPLVALDAGTYGIDVFRRLLVEAADFIKPRGMLTFEMGAGQEKLVERLIEKNGQYENIEYFRYDGRIRVVSVVRKG